MLHPKLSYAALAYRCPLIGGPDGFTSPIGEQNKKRGGPNSSVSLAYFKPIAF